MAEKRRGLGRGLGALIPSAPSGDSRPVDVFFPGVTAVAERDDTSGPPDAPVEAGPGGTDGEVDGAASAGLVPAPHGDPARPWGPSESSDGLAETPQGNARDPRRDAFGPGTDGHQAADGAGANGAAADGAAADRAAADRAAAAGGVGGGNGTSPTTDVDPAPDLVTVPGAHFAEIPVTAITPNPRQPRTVFDEEALAELVGSIREVGVLQPVVVRPLGPGPDGPRYELIMGERRWRAAQQAGLDRIPAIVRETEDDVLLRDALLENLHRSQLNALEEAAAYQQLLDDFGCTHEELAQRIHRSRPQISNTLRLLRLPPLVQRRVAAGVLSAGHARALLGLVDGAAMERLAQRIVAEGLSVRATEEIVTLGGEPAGREAVRRPRAGDRNAALDYLASRLSDRFETRVKIALGRTKGRLTVEFASVQDLNRILGTLSPEDPGLLR